MRIDEPTCPMGKNPWLATFIMIAFVLVVVAKKMGWM